MTSLLHRLTAPFWSAIDRALDFSIDWGEERWSRIDDGLWVGARPRLDDVETLRDAGITHVISCLDEGERESVAFLSAAFETLFVPVRDSMDADLGAAFPGVCAFAEQAWSADPQARVLVHCEVGVSRSATVATALLMKSRRLRFLDAFEVARAGRPIVLPNIGFASQLQRFERERFPESPPGPSSLAIYLQRVCNAPVDVATLDDVLSRHDEHAPTAIRALFGGEIPRVVQGVRR